MAANPSPEVKAILKQTHDLTTDLSNDTLGMAGILLSKELISIEAYSKMLLLSLTPAEKAAVMIESTRKIVEKAPEKFTEFVEALSGQACAKEVVEKLRSTYQSELKMLYYNMLSTVDREIFIVKNFSSTTFSEEN